MVCRKTFFSRLSLLILVSLTLLSVPLAISSVWIDGMQPSKLFATTSGLAVLTGLWQLEVSGWVNRVLNIFGDEEQFPSGPPSNEMRRMYILYDPDKAISRWCGDILFFDAKTGFWFGVSGTMAGLLSVWV